MSVSLKRRLQVLALAGFVTAPLVEGASYMAGRYLQGLGLMYVPPDNKLYERWSALREPALGWPSPKIFGQGEMDARGSRVVPAFPDANAPSCVSVFGDSFTYGSEVTPEESYPNVLALRLKCRVNNFGAQGYGTDQSLLRFRKVGDDSRFVVLGHFSEGIVRNVNQYRDFLGGVEFALKPRFELDAQGQLQLIPIPEINSSHVLALDRDPGSLLAHDYFLPGGPAGIVSLRFPYTWSVVKTANHFRVRAQLMRRPSYSEFYAVDHPSGALPLTTAIIRQFVLEASQRGQVPLVLLIPTLKDLTAREAGQPVAYDTLLNSLSSPSVPFVDLAVPLAKRLDGRRPCEMYVDCGSGRHFTPEANEIVAQTVFDWIKAYPDHREEGPSLPKWK